MDLPLKWTIRIADLRATLADLRGRTTPFFQLDGDVRKDPELLFIFDQVYLFLASGSFSEAAADLGEEKATEMHDRLARWLQQTGDPFPTATIGDVARDIAREENRGLTDVLHDYAGFAGFIVGLFLDLWTSAEDPGKAFGTIGVLIRRGQLDRDSFPDVPAGAWEGFELLYPHADIIADELPRYAAKWRRARGRAAAMAMASRLGGEA